MIELILLFVLLLLTALARFIVFGAFEPQMFALIFLFPVASLIIYFVSKSFAAKERSYQPKDIEDWSFYHLQKSLLIKKPLFKGKDQKGYVKRYFPRKWQYALGDIFGFNWYLSLGIQIDEDQFDVRWFRKKWFTNQDQWEIYKNGVLIGVAHTLINVKNATKLKEAIEYSFYDKTYMTSAMSVTSTISLTQNEELLGTLKPHHLLSNVRVIELQDDQPEYVVSLMVHSFYFKHK